VIIAERPFLRDHSLSIAGSVVLHGLLVVAAFWLAARTTATRHVVPAVIDATLVTQPTRRYVNPEPAPAQPAPTPEPPAKPTPTPAPAPKAVVHPTPAPPVPAPQPQPQPKTKPSPKVDVGQTQKHAPKVEEKPKPHPQPSTLSKKVESEIDREIRETQQAKAADAERRRTEELRRAQAAQAAQAAKVAEQQKQALVGETNQYVADVKARVERAWTRPASAKKGTHCTLEVSQAPTGTVLQAQVIEPCNGDAAVRASIRDAVFRASPLPVPKNPDVFQRNLQLVFSPDE
jgi:colicin import membrane protein